MLSTMPEPLDERLAHNRANWDDRTHVHVTSDFYDVKGWLRDNRGPKPRELEALGDVTGLRLLQLQCHFGLETLEWARAGATVTGLDFSPNAINAARDIAERAGLADRATFVCADVHDAVEALEHATFDIVYVSLGAIYWLPSVERWAEQVGALVAPGGRFYLFEGHPLMWTLSEDELKFEYSYFEEIEPFVGDSDQTYTDARHPIVHQRTYEWNHGIGETVTALIRNGLQLQWLKEHDWTVFNPYPWMVTNSDGTWSLPPDKPRLPLTYSLLAAKPGGV
jgi:SAM-dependent methyltransferase